MDTPPSFLLTHFAMGMSLLGSGILCLTFFYLWHLSPQQKALQYWGLAFLAYFLGNVLALLSPLLAFPFSHALPPLFLAVMVIFLWRGNRLFSGRQPGFDPFFPLFFAALWGLLSQEAGVDPTFAQLPLFLLCSLLLAHTGLHFWNRAHQSPHAGYRLTGGLFFMLALHLAAHPLFRLSGAPVATSIEFTVSASLLFCIGLSLILSSEREQRQAAERLSRELLEEASRRGEAEQALQTLNRELETQVDERTKALADSQNERIRQEKWAALGALVAGLSHELNTPIGNSLTVASTLQKEAHLFSERLCEGQPPLRRSELQHFIARSTQACDLLERSLARASELIQGFKQVAIDQSSQQRRCFALSVMVDELLITLKPMFQNRAVRISTDIGPHLMMESYPGPLGQVLTNLIANALLHAFSPEDETEGLIQISAAPCDDNHIELRFSDNGSGISRSDLPRIYDPFFTTRLGQGGSGLGLHIVHQIVTEGLQGAIMVCSEEGKGTCFTVRLPCKTGESGGNPSAILALTGRAEACLSGHGTPVP